MIDLSREPNTYILTATCRAGTGVVAAVSGFLAENNCYILSLEQFDDESTAKFFMRAVFRPEAGAPSIEQIDSQFGAVAERLQMQWQMHNPRNRTRVMILVSKYDHCLNDLLYRHRTGDLHMEITAVVSNHEDLRPLVEREGLPFHHMPVTADSKAEQEARILQLVESTGTELVLLARYMQILSAEMADSLSGRCINIHHSFLPGFKGAKPYHQAYERGVKVIGATAHYVTSQLDEGPIIEQVVTRVDHNHKPHDLERVGRDNESLALAKAVSYHIEHRVFLDGNKTVVFLGS